MIKVTKIMLFRARIITFRHRGFTTKVPIGVGEDVGVGAGAGRSCEKWKNIMTD